MAAIKELIGRIKGRIKRMSAEHPKRAQAFLCGLIVLGMGIYTFAISDSNLKASLERIAREEYRMQRPEEVIFFIKDRPASEEDEDK